MSESILTSTKRVLNLGEDDESFDQDVIMHINSAFSTLNQLGVGPDEGFMITDAAATWDTFSGADPRLNHIKSYVYLYVRMLFDPPTTAHHVAAMEKQKQEFEWRLNVQREEVKWTDPNTPSLLP